MEKKILGIYIHIPFCKSKCKYCDFVSFQGIEEKQEEYMESLIKEIEDQSTQVGSVSEKTSRPLLTPLQKAFYIVYVYFLFRCRKITILFML